MIPHVSQFPHFFVEGHNVVGLDKNDPNKIIPDPREEFSKNYLVRSRMIVPNLKVKGGVATSYDHEELALKLTGKAVAFIEQHRNERFFLYFAHRNVHSPVNPNPRFKGKSEIGVYGDFINELDWSVGEVLSTLYRLKLTDNTLVIFSSDNGGVAKISSDSAVINGLYLNGPLRGKKTEVWEGANRVPFLAQWPGHIPSGKTSDQLLALTDMLATFAALTGKVLPDNAGEDSFNLLPALFGNDAGKPMRPVLVTDAMMEQLVVREGPWKLIPCQGSGGYPWDRTIHAGDPPGQLYNLADDLGGTKNLYTEKPGIVKHLTELLEKVKREGRSRP